MHASSPTEPRAQGVSWPPTQVRLLPTVPRNNAGIEDLDLARMDEDPLTYFLTPAPVIGLGHDGVADDAMDFEMDFDAGIEDAKRPAPIVRSVSPSSLGGLSLPPGPRPPTPPRSMSPATPELDHDMSLTPDDNEDYMQFAPRGSSHSFTFPIRLKDLTSKSGSRARDARAKKRRESADAYLSAPVSFPISSNRGRSATRPGPRPTGALQARGRSSTLAIRRSLQHSWREPSPDVWSIEEETEEEINSEMGDSGLFGDRQTTMSMSMSEAIQIPAAKPKKRVRFVLPDQEEAFGGLQH